MLRWRDEDVPVDFYAAAWGCVLPDVIPDAMNSMPAKVLVEQRRSKGTKTLSAKAKLKAKKTREANKQLQRDLLNQNLKAEDMRKRGVQNQTMKGLDAMLAEYGGKKLKP